ncbi:MAG: HEAT repeat domain-containing protein [Candidatus Heimdallarchaeota archaeon]
MEKEDIILEEERIEALIPLLSDEKIKESVIQTLYKIGKSSIAPLKALYAISDRDMRVTIIRINGRIGVEALPELIAALDDNDRWVQLTAIRYLGTLGSKATAALPKLDSFLDEPKSLLGTKALWAIGEITEDSTPYLDIIEDILDSDQYADSVFEVAIELLGKLATPLPEHIFKILSVVDSTIDSSSKVVLKSITAMLTKDSTLLERTNRYILENNRHLIFGHTLQEYLHILEKKS